MAVVGPGGELALGFAAGGPEIDGGDDILASLVFVSVYDLNVVSNAQYNWAYHVLPRECLCEASECSCAARYVRHLCRYSGSR